MEAEVSRAPAYPVCADDVCALVATAALSELSAAQREKPPALVARVAAALPRP